jgi:hypothetical protein
VNAVVAGPMTALATLEDLNRAVTEEHGQRLAISSQASGLAIDSSSSTRATGRGQVTRTTTVGDQQSTETFDGPFDLAFSGGVWRVVNATYDGSPLVVRDVHRTGRQGGVQVILASVLDFGHSTAALFAVENVGGGQLSVAMTGATITRGGTTTGTGRNVLVTTDTGILEGYAGALRGTGTVTSVELRFKANGQDLAFRFAL